MKQKRQSLICTILADEKPVAAIEASAPEARELLKEQGFLQELSGLKVDGEPLYKPVTRLRQGRGKCGRDFVRVSRRPGSLARKSRPWRLAQRRLSTHYSRENLPVECCDWP